jgi:hypothetical protein
MWFLFGVIFGIALTLGALLVLAKLAEWNA